MTQLITTNTTNSTQQYIQAIENNQTLGDKTKVQYIRAIKRAVKAEVNLLDAVAVADYAATLPSSSRSFLRGALRQLTQRQALEIKSGATGDASDTLKRQAALMRLDALSESIKLTPKKGTRAHNWLTASQVAQMMAKMDISTKAGLRDKVALALMVGAGLRREEAVTVKFSDMVPQGDRCVINVQGKGEKMRAIPLSSGLCELINEWGAVVGNEGTILRRVNKGGRVGDSLSGSALVAIAERAGSLISETIKPHDLRRTFAQLGLDNGFPIQQISKLLGHASIATTQKYLNTDLDLSTTISDFIPMG